MRLKTILLTTVATGTLMCEPVMAYAVDSTPDSMGWFRKKKKSEPNDSVKSKNEYEKLTGDGSIFTVVCSMCTRKRTTIILRYR